MKKLYDQHIFPHLIYAITVWGTEDERKTYIQPLIRTHKKIIRIVANTKPRAHTRPIMQQLSILTLSNLYRHRVCTEMHPHIFQQRQKNRPQHSHSYIGTAHIHHYRTRYSRQNNQYIRNNRYRKNPYRKDKQGGGAENHFSRKYAAVWNSIDDQLKNIENTKQFAKELKKWLLSQQANRR